MTDLDRNVIMKMLSSEEAMKTAKEFIQKYRESLQVPFADLPVIPDKP